MVVLVGSIKEVIIAQKGLGFSFDINFDHDILSKLYMYFTHFSNLFIWCMSKECK